MTQPFDNRDWDLRQIAEKDADVERLKAICARAADALERVLPMKKYAWLDWYPYYDLKAELRKAAE